MRKRQQRKTMRAAGKAPTWVREIAMTKVVATDIARHKRRRLGTFGPASPCVRIDPVTGEAVEILRRSRP